MSRAKLQSLWALSPLQSTVLGHEISELPRHPGTCLPVFLLSRTSVVLELLISVDGCLSLQAHWSLWALLGAVL